MIYKGYLWGKGLHPCLCRNNSVQAGLRMKNENINHTVTIKRDAIADKRTPDVNPMSLNLTGLKNLSGLSRQSKDSIFSKDGILNPNNFVTL